MGEIDRLCPNQIDKVFRLLQSLEGGLSLPLALTLFAIAREPGLSVGDLALRINAPQQTASRYVAILQGRYETSSSGDDDFSRNPLISLEISREDPRKRALFLTDNGVDRVTKILEIEGKNDNEKSPSNSA
jgi:DNA-binding MarR family transcriptional regulator